MDFFWYNSNSLHILCAPLMFVVHFLQWPPYWWAHGRAQHLTKLAILLVCATWQYTPLVCTVYRVGLLHRWPAFFCLSADRTSGCPLTFHELLQYFVLVVSNFASYMYM